MSKIKRKFQYLPDGSVDIPTWLASINDVHQFNDTTTLAKACEITQKLTHGLTTFYGQPVLELGLEVAETILEFKYFILGLKFLIERFPFSFLLTIRISFPLYLLSG